MTKHGAPSNDARAAANGVRVGRSASGTASNLGRAMPLAHTRTPYLAEFMDCISTGSPWERVVLMKGAQLGATEAALNWIGYIIHHAPGLALLVMPSLEMARRNTRTRLDPMIETTPALREVIAAPRSRDAYNSAFTKSFRAVCWS